MKRTTVTILLALLIPANALAEREKPVDDPFAKLRAEVEEAAKRTGLKAMHTNLRAASELAFTTKFKSVDRLLGTTETGEVSYVIRKPKELRVTAEGSKAQITVISDGNVLTIHDRKRRKYRQSPAREEILGSLYVAAGLVGVQPRMFDFFWTVDYLDKFGDYPKIVAIEPQTIGGQTCDGVRLSFRDDEWTVWLERSDRRFPCRLISKKTDHSGSTIQTNTFAWAKDAQISEGTFAFVPPEGHTRE